MTKAMDLPGLFREQPYSDMSEMIANDEVAQAFGIRLIDWGKGWCRLSMEVRKGMLNAYGAAHGSVVYALADCAFAIAGNSYATKSVALSVTISYRRQVTEGEQLLVEAREESRGKTTTLCRMRVTNGDGKIVALADGISYLSRQQPWGQRNES
jgi:acyl-CoA thioesterase